MDREISGGLKDAFENYGKGDADDDMGNRAEGSSEHKGGGGGHKGHSGHVMRHSNGKHHVTVHDKHGQMVHHSEHNSWKEASDELGQHGASEGVMGAQE